MNRGGGGVEGRLNIYRQWESTFRPAAPAPVLPFKKQCVEAELGAAIFWAAPEPVFLSVGAKNRSHLIFKSPCSCVIHGFYSIYKDKYDPKNI